MQLRQFASMAMAALTARTALAKIEEGAAIPKRSVFNDDTICFAELEQRDYLFHWGDYGGKWPQLDLGWSMEIGGRMYGEQFDTRTM